MKKIVVFILIAIFGIACLSSCEEFFHTHTYEIKECPEGHFKSYTCGCELEMEVEEHIDENGDGSCDICTHKHTTDTWRLKDGHKTVYTCGCESLNVMNNHVDEDGDYYCDICRGYMPKAVLLSDIETWLKTITAEETIAVTTWYSDGIQGYGLKEKVAVTDKADIAKIIESYKNLEILPLDPNVSYYISPDSFRVIFTTESGYHQLMVNGGFMFTHKDGTYNVSYDMSNVPEIDGYDSSEVSYMFDVFYGYNQGATVFDPCGELVCKVENISDLEFVESEYLAENTPLYIIETGVGIISVHSERHFMYDGKCYELINSDFLELVKIWSGEDYSLTMSNEKGYMIA